MRKALLVAFCIISIISGVAQSGNDFYYQSRQISDSSFSIKRGNNDSTVFIFQGGNGFPSSIPSLANRDFPNDSIAVLSGGLVLWDIYRTGNSVKIVTSYPSSSSDFNYVVDNSNGTNALQSVRMYGWRGNFNVLADWGDGTPSSLYKDAQDYTMTHTYTQNGTYNPHFTVSDSSKVLQLFMNTTGVPTNFYSINHLLKFSSLLNLVFSQAKTANITFNNLELPPSLNVLLVNNSVTNFDPEYSLPPNLTQLYISGLTSPFAPHLGLPSTINQMTLTWNSWTSAEVNSALIYLDSLTFNSGTKTLDIRQGSSSSAPTGNGLNAKNSLISKGWSITTD